VKLTRSYLLALMTFLLPVAAWAQVTFTNNDGTFTANGNKAGSTLSLTGSDLTAISGLSGFGIANSAVAFPTCKPNCLGTITLTTGALLTGGTMLTGGTFAANSGTFSVAYADGVSFTGTFSSSSWTHLGSAYAFSGTIMNGILTVNGISYDIATATSIQLTTTGTSPVITKTGTTISKITFQDNQGTTNFMAPVPEPGTLSLFGGGLIVVGILARKRLRSETKGSGTAQ
jgi:hypothetical protein